MNEPTSSPRSAISRVANLTALAIVLTALVELGRAAELPVAILHSLSFFEGYEPEAGVVLDANGSLYGTDRYGENGQGKVISVKIDGSEFRIVHEFLGPDGSDPFAGLVIDAEGNLYGTTKYGGIYGQGTIFRVKTDGSGFAVLHSFSTSPDDGVSPVTGLALGAGGKLYGTAGGLRSEIIFRINTDGNEFTILHSSSSLEDGGFSTGDLIFDSLGNLYGTTFNGGASANCESGCGSVFTLKSDGSGFAILHSFSGPPGNGASPLAGVTIGPNGSLYGTTWEGGSSEACSMDDSTIAGCGTLFTVKTDGTGYAVLHSFAGGHTDGSFPNSIVVDNNGNLYGTASNGGRHEGGVLFTVKPNGTGYSIVHSFSDSPTDGELPNPGLIYDSAGNLYGMTYAGGATSSGTVFRVMIPPITSGRGDVSPTPGASLIAVGERP